MANPIPDSIPHLKEPESRTQHLPSIPTNVVPPPKPPTDIHPSAYLDPQAYIQGINTITLSENVLIHPRARLVSVYGPLIIGAGTVISERCVIGGPGPDPREPLSPASVEPVSTVIGQNVMLHATAEVEAGAFLDDGCLIEPRAIIKKGVDVGKHSKVCAGCVVDRSLGDWMVVWNDGQRHRIRTGAMEPETGRLRALANERDATAGLLKATALKATLNKRKG